MQPPACSRRPAPKNTANTCATNRRAPRNTRQSNFPPPPSPPAAPPAPSEIPGHESFRSGDRNFTRRHIIFKACHPERSEGSQTLALPQSCYRRHSATPKDVSTADKIVIPTEASPRLFLRVHFL